MTMTNDLYVSSLERGISKTKIMSPAAAETANVDVTTTLTEWYRGAIDYCSLLSWHLPWKMKMTARVEMVKLRHRAKFRGDRSNLDRDAAVFCFSRWRPPPSWIFNISNL